MKSRETPRRHSVTSNLSEFHICTTGRDQPDFGTRGGDSGSPLNYLENNRFADIRKIKARHFVAEIVCRFAAIGVNSFNSDPDVFAKITPEVKTWIQSIAANTQDSDCLDTVKS